MAQNITELSFGVTADMSGVEMAMTRVAAATKQAIQGITRAQEDLGASRGMDGILKITEDEVTRVVEGLQNWQIAMGYSRDEMGQLVNKNGQMIEGLTTLQQKMGYYKDALGDVYNSEGNLVQLGEKSIKAAEAEEKAIQAKAAAQEKLKQSLTVLRNEQGQIIENLTDVQVALGITRNEQLQMVNANGKLVQGLSDLQIKMGYYKDDLDNVYNSEGNLIQQGAKAIAAQKEREKVVQVVTDAIEAQNRAIEQSLAAEQEQQAKNIEDANKAAKENIMEAANALQFMTSMLVTFSAGGGETAKRLQAISASAAAFTSTMQVLPQIARWYQSLTVVTNLQTGAIQRQTLAQGLLNAFTGNWVMIAAGAAAAVTTFAVVSQMEDAGQEAEKATDKVDNMTDAVKRLNEEAAKAGESVWGFEQMRTVISDMVGSKEDNLLKNVLNIDEIRANLNIAKKDIASWSNQISKAQDFLAENKPSDTMKGWAYDKVDQLSNSSWSSLLMSANAVTGKIPTTAVDGKFDYEQRMQDIDDAEKRIVELQEKIKNAKNVDDKGVTQGLGDLVNGIIGRSQSEMDGLRKQIEILQAAVKPDKEGETLVDPELGNKALTILQEKLLAPLQDYASQVEKTTKSFAWLDEITDETIKKGEAYKKAVAERTKQMERAELQDSMTAEQLKLYDQIQGYMSPWERFSQEQENLSYLLQTYGVGIEGWLEASKKSEDSLLASTKYGSFLKKAQEGLMTFDEKLHEGFAEIEKTGLLAGKSREVIDAAKEDFRNSLDDSQKKEQEARPGVAAAERGSMEAHQIVNNARQDKQVKAISSQTKELIKAQKESTDRTVEALSGKSQSFQDVDVL
jgi:hypothetical protein